MKEILIIDNYDSFTYNLVQLVRANFNGRVQVQRNDDFFIKQMDNKFAAIIISPGPKKPVDIPQVKDLIKRYYKKIPILGICLGMQCISEVFGGRTVRAPKPIHGKTSRIKHNKKKIFKNIPQNIDVARYHSLITKLKNSDFEITATTASNIIMGLQHKIYNLSGLQFHPESFLTQYGSQMINNWLELL